MRENRAERQCYGFKEFHTLVPLPVFDLLIPKLLERDFST